jgi:hypothetical protein
VSFLIVLVAVAIVGGIVVVAMGRGGELARDGGGEPEITSFESWADVASYRPPAALLGYHARTTEHALQLIGRAIADRDAEIAWLRSRLRELQPEGERSDGAITGQSATGGPQQASLAPKPRPELPADQIAQATPVTRVADEG